MDDYAVYGFLVYGTLLKHQFSHFPNVYRPDAAQMTFMPIMFGGILLAMVAAAFMYAKGYEGGSGVAEGMRFGMLPGVSAAGYAAIVGYALTNIDHFLGFHLILANFFTRVVPPRDITGPLRSGAPSSWSGCERSGPSRTASR